MEGSVRKRGKKWYYYFDIGNVNGKRKRIERVGGNTKKEALESLRKALSEFDGTGNYIEESKMLFADYLDFWLENYVKVNCKYLTHRNYSNVVNVHLKPKLGLYKLKAITPAILQNYLNDMQKEGYAKRTVDDHKGMLSNAFKYSVYPCQYLKENPMQYVKVPKYDIKKEDKLKVITLDDYKRILNRFPEGHKLNIPIQIAFHTGLRGSEVCGLTWDNIDFNEKTLTVDKILLTKSGGESELQTPKTNSSYRTIAIGDTLIKVLRQHKKSQLENKLKYGEFYIDNINIDYKNYTLAQEKGFICRAENGEVVTTTSLKHLSQVVNKQLKIPFSFHSLRHTHATILIEAGANMKDVQERLGHSRLSTTMDTYSHVTDKMKRDTVDIFENIIL